MQFCLKDGKHFAEKIQKNSEKFTEGTKSYYQLILKSGNNSAQDKST